MSRVLAVLIIAGGVAGYFGLKSHLFQEYVRHRLVAKLNGITGGGMEIESLDLRPYSLTADLYNVAFYSTKATSQPPRLHVDRITVKSTLRSLLFRRERIYELIVNHPILYMTTNGEGGGQATQFAKTLRNSGANPFDLSIRHLLISNGAIQFKDKQNRFEADVYDLQTEIRVNPRSKRYAGDVSYHNGRLQYLNYEPVRHSLTAKVAATADHLSIESMRVELGSSIVIMRGEVDDLNNPRLDAEYEMRIHTQDFGRTSAVALRGDIALSGKLHYASAGDRDSVLNWSVAGRLSSNAIEASVSAGMLEAQKVYAEYQLLNGEIRARSIGAELLGGRVSLDVAIQHLEAQPRYHVTTSLQGLSLEALKHAISRTQPMSFSLSGSLDGTADATWIGSINSIVTRCDLRFHGTANGAVSPPEKGVPVLGNITVGYDRLRNSFSVQPTRLQISSMNLAVQGEAGDHSNLHIDAVTADLQQFSRFLSTFGPRETKLPEISGTAALETTMQGPLQTPRFTGYVTAEHLRVNGSRWNSIVIAGHVSPTELVVHNASLAAATRGKAFVSARVDLRNWLYHPTNSISVDLSMQRMSIVELQRLAKLRYPIVGELSGNLVLRGSEVSPAGSGNLAIHGGRIYGEPLRRVVAEISTSQGSIGCVADIDLPAGSARMSVSYSPGNRAYTLNLDAPSVLLQELQAVREMKVPLEGVVKTSVSGRGTLDDPEITAILDLHDARIYQQMTSPVRAEVHIAKQRAEAEIISKVGDAPIHLRAHVNLGGDYDSEATVDTDLFQLDSLLGVHAQRLRLQAQTELHAVVKGSLKRASGLEAQLTIPTLRVTYQGSQIGAVAPIRVDYARSMLTLWPVEFRGSDTALRVQGTIPSNGTQPLTFSAEGSVDASLLRVVDPGITGSGTCSFDIRTSGTARRPLIEGRLGLRDVALSTPTQLAIVDLNGSLHFDNNRLRVSDLSGRVGGGQLSIAGSVVYSPSLQLDLLLDAKAVRMRYPGLRVLLDSNLALTGKLNASLLKGSVSIEDFSFTPDFDLTRLSQQFGGSRVSAGTRFADTVKLAIAVQSRKRLNATSPLAKVEGDVDLRVVGTVSSPVVTGRADLTSGELLYRTRRYQLQRGAISFNDPTRSRPMLDISATTTVQQYNLTMTLRGPLDRLVTTYTSDPPLATAEIIRLIALGSTTQTVNGGGHGTDSILASQVAGQVSTKMQSLTGISGLRIDPLVGGSDRNPSARIAIQQRVTKNFLFTFSTVVSEPGNETVQGDYRINNSWSVGVARDPVGGVSVQGKYHTKF